jgi:hypothetical protein
MTIADSLTRPMTTTTASIIAGIILLQKKSPVPQLDVIEPDFHYDYDKELHGTQLAKDLDISHLNPLHAKQLIAFIKQYWTVFDERGMFTPVCGYQCVIDTGNAKPIEVKKIMYDPKETVIKRKCIAALEKVGHIYQIHDSQWLFKALLAAKLHQEHILNIEDFVWRFCVKYIPLNQVTCQIAYPIPCCDHTINLSFGIANLLLAV